jgi:acetyl-CoA carboxylase biotin carboxylase subunit
MKPFASAPPRARSYLDIPSIISAAEITNVDAIHPGYGFLSENARFAEVCEVSGIKFIGPRPEVIQVMGLKERARAIMHDAGVPILPGSGGVIQSAEEALETAASIGYPVILKASAGGGGRGMRIVNTPPELAALLAQAQQEAGAAFGSPDIYPEKYIPGPRHIEFRFWPTITVMSKSWASASAASTPPSSGGGIAFPADAGAAAHISDKLREAIRSVGYTNAGTVNF